MAATGWYGPERSTEARIAAAAERNRRAGFDLFEIPLLDPYAFDVADARRVLAGGSLEVAASLGLPEHADISTAEPDKVSAGEALLIKALEVLSDLDSRHLCGVLYGMLKKYPEESHCERLPPRLGHRRLRRLLP